LRNPKKVLGFLINPIAGLGGPAGFKGTDRPDIVDKALRMGIKPRAPKRGYVALSQLSKLDMKVLVPPKDMGYEIARKILPPENIEVIKLSIPSSNIKEKDVFIPANIINPVTINIFFIPYFPYI